MNNNRGTNLEDWSHVRNVQLKYREIQHLNLSLQDFQCGAPSTNKWEGGKMASCAGDG